MRAAFEFYLSCGKLAAVVALLRSRAPGRRWSHQGVRYLLRNETYVGVTVYAGKRARGRHEPLVSRETFDAVGRLLGRGRGA